MFVRRTRDRETFIAERRRAAAVVADSPHDAAADVRTGTGARDTGGAEAHFSGRAQEQVIAARLQSRSGSGRRETKAATRRLCARGRTGTGRYSPCRYGPGKCRSWPRASAAGLRGPGKTGGMGKSSGESQSMAARQGADEEVRICRGEGQFSYYRVSWSGCCRLSRRADETPGQTG